MFMKRENWYGTLKLSLVISNTVNSDYAYRVMLEATDRLRKDPELAKLVSELSIEKMSAF